MIEPSIAVHGVYVCDWGFFVGKGRGWIPPDFTV